MEKLLHLWAQDAEDLLVISASLQDAVMKASDMAFDKSQKRFALMANRFCWERKSDKPVRTRAGMHFDNVLAVKAKNIQQKSDQTFVLLAILFEAAQGNENSPSPEGTIRLMFSGEAELSLTVEALHVVMQDVMGSWVAKSMPQHDLKEE
ncbi:MAG: DUF2948 family protein [Parvibaculales bacterium]